MKKLSKEEVLNKCSDNIKFEYCKNNNIRLLTIPYNQISNIKDILNNSLNINNSVI